MSKFINAFLTVVLVIGFIAFALAGTGITALGFAIWDHYHAEETKP